MRYVRSRRQRVGVAALEFAIIINVVLALIFLTLLGGIGTLRYEQLAQIAHETARYASTHGAQYRKDAGLSNGTSSDWYTDINNNGFQAHLMGLDPNSLSLAVSWSPVPSLPSQSDNWPGATVTVTVSYAWTPGFYITGTYHMSSTSVVTITN
jgi:Flp pilus assembly protein TadG